MIKGTSLNLNEDSIHLNLRNNRWRKRGRERNSEELKETLQFFKKFRLQNSQGVFRRTSNISIEGAKDYRVLNYICKTLVEDKIFPFK